MDKKSLHPSTSMSRFDRLLPSDNKKYHYSSWEAQICKNMFSPHLVCADFYNKTPKNVELFGTFLHLYGTELKWNRTTQLSNKSTGTMEKNLPKSLAVLTFSCGTIGMNSRFLLVVLLFQQYYRVNFGRFKLEINRNEHYLLWKWYIKVSLIHINLMCMVED